MLTTSPAQRYAPSLISTLLTLSSPVIPTNAHPETDSLLSATDNDGNTALHYALAFSSLPCARILLAAGADPNMRNAYDWTPGDYSGSVGVEVGFKALIKEMEERREEGERVRVQEKRGKEAGLRVVTQTGDEGGEALRERVREERKVQTPGSAGVRGQGW